MAVEFDFDLDEALAREKVTRDDLKHLRELDIKGMPDAISDHQLLLFYSACDHDFEKTKVTIENYCHYKRTVPEFFTKRDPKDPHIQHSLENSQYFFLPVTPTGYSVIYARLINQNTADFYFNSSIKTYLMTVDSCLSAQGPRPGIIFILDAENATMGLMYRMSYKAIGNFTNYVYKCLPAKLCEMHIINTNWICGKLVGLVRPFLKSDCPLYLHAPTTDYELLFKGKIPKECLPSDLGGELNSIEDLHREHNNRLFKMRNYFIEEEKLWTEEKNA